MLLVETSGLVMRLLWKVDCVAGKGECGIESGWLVDASKRGKYHGIEW
jgi:hypothetical protein